MKKLVIKIIVLITINYSGFSQNWSTLGFGLDGGVSCFYPDTGRDILWVGGWFLEASHIKAITIANWNNIKWDTLPNQLAGNGINAIINYDSSLFVGGYDGCFIFKNNQWMTNPLYNGFSLFEGYITDFKILNNKLYAIGGFDHVNGITANSIAMYDGLSWQSVDNFNKYNPGNGINIISSIEYYKGKLYIAGKYADSLSGGYPVLASCLDSAGWHTIGGVLHGSFAHIFALCIYKNNLYIAGSFLKSDGNLGDNIIMYDGTDFHEVGTGLQGGQVFDLIVYDSCLIACGQFTNAGNINTKYLAKWDGSKWCSFGSDFDIPLGKLGVFRNELYIGCGRTIDGDSVHYVAKWIGGNYVDTCSQAYGITEIDNNNNFIIYPNPATDFFTISTDNNYRNKTKIVNIYSIEGVLVKQKNYTEDEIRIDTSEFPSGIFIVELKTKEGSWYKKVVVTSNKY